MTRYWDSWAESLELVMRFISCRNWSSVGVAIVGISLPGSCGRGSVRCVLLRAANACVSWFENRESRMRMRVGGGLCEVVEVHFLLSLSVAFQTETKEILINNDMSRLTLIQYWSSGAARHSFTCKR